MSSDYGYMKLVAQNSKVHFTSRIRLENTLWKIEAAFVLIAGKKTEGK